jgi:hypothetical protein
MHVQRDNGHPELAAQVPTFTRDANCGAFGIVVGTP